MAIKFHSNENTELHSMQLDWIWLNSIGKKWDANWCEKYWKLACDYGVIKKEKKTEKLVKYTNPER